MNKDRTRLFEAKYTSSDGKKHDLNVRVFKHLRYFGLSLALVGTLSGCLAPMSIDAKTDEKGKSSFEETIVDKDRAFIDSIIASDPYRLETHIGTLHTVELGESLSSIAEEYGTSVKKICSSNGIDSKTIIRPGDKIQVTRVERLEGLDEDIVCLETFLNEYLFKNPVETEDYKNSTSYVKILVYGEPKNEVEIDPTSPFGMFVNAYTQYHEDGVEHDEDAKKEYVETLLDIENSVVTDVNNYLGTDALTTYSQFKIYMKNGNTKSEELVERRRTVYD